MSVFPSARLLCTTILLGGVLQVRGGHAADAVAALDSKMPTRIWLSHFEVKNVRVGWGSYGKNGWTGYSGNRIVVNQLYSPHGLGMHAEGQADYGLHRRFRTFRATAAMDDSTVPAVEWPVEFRVYGDGRLLWTSPGMRTKGDSWPCMLDVSGVDVLRLETHFSPNGSGSRDNAHSVWVEPYVSVAAPRPEVLAYFNQAGCRRIETTVRFQDEVATHLRKEEFDALEKIADRYRAKDDYMTGRSRLGLFYSALGRPNRSGEPAWNQHLALLDKWQKAKPDSPTALIATARAYHNWAWNARGGGWASEVTEQGAKLLEERNRKAQDLLLQAMKKKASDPAAYDMFIDIALTEGQLEGDVQRVFNEGRKRFPRYYPLYNTMANYLLPKWHGQPGEVESCAAEVRDDLGGELGQEIYMRMAGSIYHDVPGGEFFQREGFEIDKLMPGIRVALRDFPENTLAFNFACHAACVGKKDDLAAQLLPRLDSATFLHSMWGGYGRLDSFQRKYDPASRDGEIAVTRAGTIAVLFSLAYCKDGSLLCGGEDARLEIWPAGADAPRDAIVTEGPVGAVAVDSAGQRAIVEVGTRYGASPFACVYDVQDGKQLATLKGHSREVVAVAISPDGKRCGTASKDGTARLWDLDNSEHAAAVLSHPEEVYDIDFSADGSSVATTSEKGGLWLWDARTGQVRGQPLVGKEQGPWRCRVRFMPKSDRLITASADNTIRVWDLPRRQFRSTRPDGGPITSLAVSPDDRWIAVGRQDGEVDVLSAESLRLERVFQEHFYPVGSVAFSPDGSELASVSWDGMLKLWPVPVIEPKTVRPSPDGAMVLAAGDAQIHGTRLIILCNRPNNLGRWTQTTDYPFWTVDADKAGMYVPEVLYSAPPACGGDFEVSAGKETVSAALPPTDGWWDRGSRAFPPIHLPAGKSTIALKIQRMRSGDSVNLLAIKLRPQGQ